MKIKKALLGVGLGIAGLLLTACGGNSNPLSDASSPQPSQSGSATGAQGAPVVVGSADFTESKILAEIYSQALKAKGVES